MKAQKQKTNFDLYVYSLFKYCFNAQICITILYWPKNKNFYCSMFETKSVRRFVVVVGCISGQSPDEKWSEDGKARQTLEL